MRHLQLVDFSASRDTPYFGDYAILNVRFGKAMKGSPKKQRVVLTTFRWAAEAVSAWVEHGLPRYGLPLTDLFPSGGQHLTDLSSLRDRFRSYVNALGFPDGLTMHSFRRSYSNNLQYVYGVPRGAVSLQLGHEHESTTTKYSFPAPAYATWALKRALDDTMEEAARAPRLRKPARGRFER